MCLHVAGLTKRSEVAGIKRQLMHINGAARSTLHGAYMVHFCGWRCPPHLLAVFAKRVRR